MSGRRAPYWGLSLIAVGLGMMALTGQAQADGPAPETPTAEHASTTSDQSPAITSPLPSTAPASGDPTRPRASRAERYRSTGPVVTSGSGRTFVLGGTANWWGRLSSGLR
jgi:hypothetical protein